MTALKIIKPSFKLPNLTLLKKRLIIIPKFINRRPVFSFVAALLILFVLIAAGNLLFKPPAASTLNPNQVKQVQVYTIGSVPKVATQAQIQNSGVITIIAQSAGIVQSVNVSEGQSVGKNTNLLTLSSNYAGANAPAIQESIAAKQYQQINDTFDSQKQIIQNQRDIANASLQNTTQLQNISAQSVVDLQAIADLNQNMLDSVQQNISDLEALPTDPTTSQQILNLKQVENQLQVAQNQTHQGILNTQYQVNPSNPPSQLSNLQQQLTLKQLDIQDKNLENSREIARLQLALADINNSLLHPTSPFGAKVEKVLVRAGEAVNPGTPLIVLSGDQQDVTAVAKVPAAMATQISTAEDSVLHLGSNVVLTKPSFVSDVATDGLLYQVIYNIPNQDAKNLTDNDFITVDIPVGVADTTSTSPFVPLDSIFQTQDQSYLYVIDQGQAKTKIITTGAVLGNYVEVTSGLTNGNQIILDRNVVEGDKVSAH